MKYKVNNTGFGSYSYIQSKLEGWQGEKIFKGPFISYNHNHVTSSSSNWYTKCSDLFTDVKTTAAD